MVNAMIQVVVIAQIILAFGTIDFASAEKVSCSPSYDLIVHPHLVAKLRYYRTACLCSESHSVNEHSSPLYTEYTSKVLSEHIVTDNQHERAVAVNYTLLHARFRHIRTRVHLCKS